MAFDAGGRLPTGWSVVFNDTGKPEAVLTSQQWSAVQASDWSEGGGG